MEAVKPEYLQDELYVGPNMGFQLERFTYEHMIVDFEPSLKLYRVRVSSCPLMERVPHKQPHVTSPVLQHVAAGAQ